MKKTEKKKWNVELDFMWAIFRQILLMDME